MSSCIFAALHATFVIFVSLTLLNPWCAFAQQLSLGVIGGGSLTDGFEERSYPGYTPPGASSPISPGLTFYSHRKDYMVGAALEWRFRPRLSLEANGIYRQIAGEWAAVLEDGTLNSVSPNPVVTWQFPILAKYRFSNGGFRPFVATGPSFRTTGNLNSSDPSHVGFSLGAGTEIPWRRMAFSPTIRYTRWARDPDRGSNSRTAPNQLELMLAFTGTPSMNTDPLGQRFRLGGILGTNLTGDFPNERYSEVFPTHRVETIRQSGSRAIIAGAVLEMRIHGPWSIEADAIYRPLPYDWQTSSLDLGLSTQQRSSFITWVFPVMAKYRFRQDGWQPFLTLGPSFRRPQSLTDSSPYGVVAGVGVARPLWKMELAPTVRYTRWGKGHPVFGAEDRRNQLELLVGITF